MGLGQGIRIVWVDNFRGRWEGEIDGVDRGSRIFIENGVVGESKEVWLDFEISWCSMGRASAETT